MNRTDFTSAFASEFARSLTKVDNTELQADAPGHGPSARNIKEQDVKRKPIYGCFDSCTQTATLHVFVCQRTSSQATSWANIPARQHWTDPTNPNNCAMSVEFQNALYGKLCPSHIINSMQSVHALAKVWPTASVAGLMIARSLLISLQVMILLIACPFRMNSVLLNQEMKSVLWLVGEPSSLQRTCRACQASAGEIPILSNQDASDGWVKADCLATDATLTSIDSQGTFMEQNSQVGDRFLPLEVNGCKARPSSHSRRIRAKIHEDPWIKQPKKWPGRELPEEDIFGRCCCIGDHPSSELKSARCSAPHVNDGIRWFHFVYNMNFMIHEWWMITVFTVLDLTEAWKTWMIQRTVVMINSTQLPQLSEVRWAWKQGLEMKNRPNVLRCFLRFRW